MIQEYTLVTGVSGFIARELVRQLSPDRPLLGMSRKKSEGNFVFVKGEFHSFEDLRQLDKFRLAGVIHLAATTGGSSEEDALEINVAGTRRLLRYALDRGCRKFVLASSIAAVGCLSKDFRPLELPIPDEHPCLARDAYGLSKAMVEDLTRYFNRVVPDSNFIHLRLGSVNDPAKPPRLFSEENPPKLPFVELGPVMLDDVVKALIAAINAPVKPGVRVYNVAGPDANCREPLPQVVRASLGEQAGPLDFAYFEQPGHSHSGLYSMEKIEKELGFKPGQSTRHLAVV